VIRTVLILVALSLTLGEARAREFDRPVEFGSGEAPRYSELYEGDSRDLLDDARAPAMSALGANALRFSSQPALGRTGYVIAMKATGEVEIAWFDGHPRLGWRRTHRHRFQIPQREYERVVAEVDRLMALEVVELQRRPNDEAEPAIVVCSDGPGYLTERIRDGEVRWLRPMCSGANADIATYLTSWSFRYLGR
jgi:hypothetical protein